MEWLQSIFSGALNILSVFVNPTLFIVGAIVLLISAILNPRGPTRAEQLVASVITGTVGIYIMLQAFRVGELDARILALVILAVGLIWIAIVSRKLLWRIVVGLAAIATIGTLYGMSVGASVSSPVANSVRIFATSITSLAGSFHH
jgi:hypothetical protein